MATLAFDDTGAGQAAKPPISTHPAFPAIVALWFASLLGLGSLVLPPVLLERMVETTGLAALVPSLAPPLGFTTRGLLAIGAAVIGALLGLAIARRVAAAHTVEPETRISKLAAGLRRPRPISVHDEIGGEGVVNGEGYPINRRRALAIAEDDRPSDFLYRAPLPGEDPFATAPPAEDPPALVDEEPLELCDAVDEAPEIDPYPADEPADEDDDMTDRPEFQPVSPFESYDEPAPELPAEEDELHLRKNAAGPRGLEPLPFSAPSLARRAPAPVAEPEQELEPELERECEPAVLAAVPPPEPEPVRGDWATAPLEGLGLVQLVQRLGSTIERRREWVAAGHPAAPTPAVPAGFEAAPAEEAAQAMAAFFGAPPATPPEPQAYEPAPDEGEPEAQPRPAFLRGPAADEDDDEDALPDFSLPLRQHGSHAAPPAQPEEDEEEDEVAEVPAEDDEEETTDDSYSSLLAMRNPFTADPAAEFVRIEEPEPESDMAEPAVVFPSGRIADVRVETGREATARLFDPPGKPVHGRTEGASASQPAAQRAAPPDTDVALRAALATLQRMSGTA